MALTTTLLSLIPSPSWPTLILVPFLSLLALAFHRLHLHPLSPFPGPLLARLTPLWLYTHTYLGTEARAIARLHATSSSPIIRIAPNQLDLSAGTALAPIYVHRGGMRKAPCYRNFDIAGWQSIFSAVDPAHRAPRARAVVGLFGTGAIRKGGGEGVVRGVAGRMVGRWEGEKRKGGRVRVDVLGLARRFALDAVSGYLFGRAYGGVDEVGGEKQLSASQFVDTFVAVGRFFYLPNWAFVAVEALAMRFNAEKHEVENSMETVAAFVKDIVEGAGKDGLDDTYHSRLLKAGFTKEETMAQCMDLMFAGTDSTGMNLATACWWLAKKPEM